jgi:competence protein ComEC
MDLAAGVFIGSVVSIDARILIVGMVFLMGILLWIHRLYSYKVSSFFGIGTHLLFICIGMLVYVRVNEKPVFYESGAFSATVLEIMQEKTASYQTILELDCRIANDSVARTSEKVMAWFAQNEKSRQLKPGDRVMIERVPQPVDHRDNPFEFDYRKYLQRRRIYRQVYLPAGSWRSIDLPAEKSLTLMAEQFRHYLLSSYTAQNLEEPGLEVLSALTLGYKRGLDPETKRVFASAGVMHVLAVSGLHVGILFLAFSVLLGFLKRWSAGRLLYIFFIISALWLFAFVTGLSPSVKRSAAMFSFVVVGAGMHRMSNIYNTLAASAFFLLLFHPNNLFDAGFQLSYLAVFGIVFLQPRMGKIFQAKSILGKYFFGLLTVSVSAQITTLPATLFYFNQFPVYSIISNLVVIPAVTLVVPMGMVLLMTSGSEIISSAISFVVDFVLQHLIHFLSLIDRLPHAVVTVPFSVTELLLLIVFLIFLLLFVEFRSGKYLRICLFIFLLLQGVVLFMKVFNLTRNEMIVYNHTDQTVLHLIAGSRNYIISESDILETDYEYRMVMNTVRQMRLEKPLFLENGFDYQDDNVHLREGVIFFAGKIISLGQNPVYGTLYPDYIITPFRGHWVKGEGIRDQQFISNRSPGKDTSLSTEKWFFLREHGAYHEKW